MYAYTDPDPYRDEEVKSTSDNVCCRTMSVMRSETDCDEKKHVCSKHCFRVN